MAGAHRRLGPAAPLHLGPARRAPALLPRRPLAGLPAGRRRRQAPAARDGHVDGGEPRRLCEHPLGVEGFAWSPDSTRIAYVARVPEEGRYGTDKDVPPEKEPPRRITAFQYRVDNLGFTFDRRPHVFVVDALAEGAEPVQVTRGDYDHGDPAWSPDGASVAFVSARHETRDEDAVSDVFVAPAAGGDAVRVTATDLAVGRPAFSPDGATIWFVASEPDLAGRPTMLWSVPADGSGKPGAAHRPGAVRPRPRLRRRDPAPAGRRGRGHHHLAGPGGDPAAALPGRRRRARRAARRPAHRARLRRGRRGGRGRGQRPPLGRRGGGGQGRPGADPDRLRGAAGPLGLAAAHGGAGGDRPRRRRRPRLGAEAGRDRAVPGGADGPRRAVRPLRLDPVRRGPGVRGRRLRGGDGQPARARPATASPTAAPSSATSATWTARTCSPCWTPPSRTRTWTATGSG